MVKLIECPRDAMQGWSHQISTVQKAAYINQLLQVGFDTIDFGSFVSPKAVPQMADTAEVISLLRPEPGGSRLLAIVANQRGAEQALQFKLIDYLGFPLSVSETFQQRNTNGSIAEGMDRIKAILELCKTAGRELVVYLSMGFGNPYGDAYSPQLVIEKAGLLASWGVRIISLADTVGLATPDQVYRLTESVINALPGFEIGVHLHSTPSNWEAKLEAAINAGCQRIDGALKGIGGCPMAGNELVGNMDTEKMIAWLSDRNLIAGIQADPLLCALQTATTLFA